MKKDVDGKDTVAHIFEVWTKNITRYQLLTVQSIHLVHYTAFCRRQTATGSTDRGKRCAELSPSSNHLCSQGQESEENQLSQMVV